VTVGGGSMCRHCGLDLILLRWVPRFRGWRRGSLYRGDGGKFLVHGEKKGGDREAAEDGSIPCMTTFLLLGMGQRSC
jgi:hypothetical protein